MKRPFAFLGFSYLLGPLAASFFGDRAILPMLLLFAAALIAALLRKAKNRNLLLALGGISLSLLVCFLTNTLYLHSFQQYDEQKYMLEGEIIELTGEKSGTSSYEVHVQKLNEIPVSFHITLYSGKQLYFTPYDKLHCGVKLSEFKEENGFSSRKSNLSKGRVLYGTLLYDKPVKVISVAKKPPAYLFLTAKHLLQISIDNFFSGDTADVLSAMLLGEGERISDEVYADFQFSGVNHILVISGMHMAIIAGVVLLLLGKIHIPRKLMLFLGMAAILLYMGMTGFGKSVVRSGIMYCILLLSFLLGEEADALNSLGFSVLLICLINPFSAVDMGFLLSVAATAGIILLAEPIEHVLMGKSRIGHFLRPLLAALSVSLAAFTFILPVILYMYGTVNPLSIVTGTILAVPSAALLAVGLIAALVGTVPFLSALMPPLVISVNLLNQFMLWVVSGIGRLGAYLPYFSQESAVLIFIGILGLTAILLLVKPTKKTCLVWGLTVLLLFATGFITSNWNPVPSVRLVTEDMGQGLFTYLVHGKEAAVLSADGYQTAYADYCLKKQGVTKITYLHTSGTDTQAATMVEKITAAIPTDILLTPETALLQENYGANRAEHYGRSLFVTPFSDQSVQVEFNLYGKLITAEIYGKKVLLEKIKIESQPLTCDLAVTTEAKTKINSAFTILRTDDIMNVTTDGNYILMPKEKFSVDFYADKAMRIRRLR